MWEHDLVQGTSTYMGEVAFWLSHPTMPLLQPMFFYFPLTLRIQTPPGLVPVPEGFRVASPPSYVNLDQYSDGEGWRFDSPNEYSPETDPSEETGVESGASRT